MDNLFIPYELALELKDLGFDEKCLAWYLPEINDKGNIPSPILSSFYSNWNKYSDRINAPLWQQAFDWILKDLDNYTIEQECNEFQIRSYNNIEWSFEIIGTRQDCLEKFIEIFKSKNNFNLLRLSNV